MALLIDGLIIVLYFVIVTSIGLYMGRRERSLHDFALGGRNVPWWAVMASIIAAETSAATFIGAPGEGFKAQSIAYAQLVIGLILGRMVVGYVFLKPYYTYKVYTVYDYLSVRFGPASKNYTAALFLVMRTLASGARLFVPSLVMVVAWQVLTSGDRGHSNKAVSLHPYVIAILLLTLLTCLYTAVGGIKAVIWTDVIQASIMFGSALVAMVSILYHIGGDSWNLMEGFRKLGELAPKMRTHEGYFLFGWEQSLTGPYMAAHKISHMSWWDWIRLTFASEFTLWSATIGAIWGNIAAFGTDQDMVQRLLTAQTYQKSRRSLITAAFMDLPIASGFAFIGVLLVAFYQQQPALKPTDNADVFSDYIVKVMPLGVRGIVLAGVFATAMGSLSAALNALATSFTNDWYIPYLARGRSERHYVGAARIFTAVFAFLMIGIAVGSAYVKVTNPDFRIIPFVIGMAGLFLGPMLGVFLIGMFTRGRGSDGGNMIAITLGLVGLFFISGQHIDVLNILSPVPRGQAPAYVLPDWVPVVKWPWFAMFGAMITFGVGVLFKTPVAALENARAKARQAQTGDERPLAMRGGGGGEEVAAVGGR
jgi:SSS family solute:Na+ symporter